MCVRAYVRACMITCVRACVRACVCVVVVVVVAAVGNWSVGCNQKQAETEEMTHGYLCSSFIFIIHKENKEGF